MYDAQLSRVAALYRSVSSTDTRALQPSVTPTQRADRAREWQAELARSMAAVERSQRTWTIVPAR
ncbi:MAG: hypothetical protein U0893_12650 [Chloroflexota bacterium]